MKHRKRWTMGEGGKGHATLSGGPLRRRRDMKELHSLAQVSEREPNPTTATAHVRIVAAPPCSEATVRPVVAAARVLEREDTAETRPAENGAGPFGQRVRAVPIENSFTDG
jgi:hypothetical protein